MTVKEAYLGINQEIRRFEKKQEKAKPKPVNHILHLLLTLVTFGFWIPIWILTSINITIGGDYSKKLEELYALRDEAELKMRRV